MTTNQHEATARSPSMSESGFAVTHKWDWPDYKDLVVRTARGKTVAEGWSTGNNKRAARLY